MMKLNLGSRSSIDFQFPGFRVASGRIAEDFHPDIASRHRKRLRGPVIKKSVDVTESSGPGVGGVALVLQGPATTPPGAIGIPEKPGRGQIFQGAEIKLDPEGTDAHPAGRARGRTSQTTIPKMFDRVVGIEIGRVARHGRGVGQRSRRSRRRWWGRWWGRWRAVRVIKSADVVCRALRSCDAIVIIRYLREHCPLVDQ